MMYLASVEKPKVWGGRLKLLAVKQPNGFWVVPLDPADSVSLPSEHHELPHKTLVFIQLNDKQCCEWLATAEAEILKFLNTVAGRVAQLARKESEIKLWHDSLEIQSEEYARRFEELDKREYKVRVKEDELEIRQVTDAVNSDAKAP